MVEAQSVQSVTWTHITIMYVLYTETLHVKKMADLYLVAVSF